MNARATDWLEDVAAPRNVGGRPAKGHTGRQRKIHCEHCEVILYGSRAALQRSGLPVCGCGERMVIANYRDRAAVERDALEGELIGYGREAYNEAARELGWPIWGAETGGAFGHSGAAQHRCAWDGGYCSVFVSGTYCREHTPGGLDSHYADRRGA